MPETLAYTRIVDLSALTRPRGAAVLVHRAADAQDNAFCGDVPTGGRWSRTIPAWVGVRLFTCRDCKLATDVAGAIEY